MNPLARSGDAARRGCRTRSRLGSYGSTGAGQDDATASTSSLDPSFVGPGSGEFGEDTRFVMQSLPVVSERNDTAASRRTRGITWDFVEILFMPIVLSDFCEDEGIPITIDWKPWRVKWMTVDDFENARVTRRRKPGSDDLRMPNHKRERILKSQGVSSKEILIAQAIARKIREHRRNTSWALPMESLFRRFGQSRRQERATLAQY
jgi:hypothetical protein